MRSRDSVRLGPRLPFDSVEIKRRCTETTLKLVFSTDLWIRREGPAVQRLLPVDQAEHSEYVILTQTKGCFFVSVMLYHYDEQ